MPKAVLFDLDDTLIAFDAVTVQCWETVCRDFIQRERPGFDADTLIDTKNRISHAYWSDPERHRLGRASLPATRRLLMRQALEKLRFFDQSKADRLADAYSVLQKRAQHVLPGAVKTLEALRARQIRLALVTNGTSDEQRDKISRFSLAPFFEAVFIEEEMGFGKPDPRVYHAALDTLRLSPDEVWMIGDNLIWDVGAPQQMGIYSVWHDYKNAGLPRGSAVVPDLIVHTLPEILGYLPESDNNG